MPYMYGANDPVVLSGVTDSHIRTQHTQKHTYTADTLVPCLHDGVNLLPTGLSRKK